MRSVLGNLQARQRRGLSATHVHHARLRHGMSLSRAQVSPFTTALCVTHRRSTAIHADFVKVHSLVADRFPSRRLHLGIRGPHAHGIVTMHTSTQQLRSAGGVQTCS